MQIPTDEILLNRLEDIEFKHFGNIKETIAIYLLESSITDDDLTMLINRMIQLGRTPGTFYLLSHQDLTHDFFDKHQDEILELEKRVEPHCKFFKSGSDFKSNKVRMAFREIAKEMAVELKIEV